MTTQELKKQIISNSLSDNFLVLQYTDNTFIIDQYVEAIAKNKNYNINKISSLSELVNSPLSIVFDFTLQLNILRVETFEEVFDDYNQFVNCIVICKDIAKNIKDTLNSYVVEIPKLVDWQIKDYIKQQCIALEDDEIDWLYKAAKGDIFRIENEIDKIKLFTSTAQHRALNELRFEYNSDLIIPVDKFKLVDAILSQDKLTVMDYLLHKNYYDINIFGLIQLLIKKICQYLYVNYKSGVDLEKYGLSAKQVNAIKYHNNYSESYLVTVLKFLTSIDQRVKLGQLDLDDSSFIDYIICNLLIIK